jgi:hypothetical protein
MHKAVHAQPLIARVGWCMNAGLNPRITISREAVATIDRLVQENGGVDEGAILCGDMNDDAQPARVFAAHGFIDTQEALMLAPIATHPCRPSDKREDAKVRVHSLLRFGSATSC